MCDLCTHISQNTYRSQNTMCRTCFFLFSTWVPRIKFRLSSFVEVSLPTELSYKSHYYFFNEAKWIQFILCIISFLWLHKNNVGNEDYQKVSVFWDGQWLETLRYTARVLFTWIFVIVIFKFLSLLYNGGNNICVLYIFKIYHVHCNEHFALLNQSLSYMLTH